MGAEYIIFGRAIPTYQLAIATYALVGVPLAAKKLTAKKEVPTNVIPASSQDEEAFIREFIKAAEEDQPKNV
ncbi:Atp19 h [Gamsiella multidivaricata]|uniref:Atp19 h n=1 Tax=Gamsiella multidivaricata TaxID=101098 RepID=UPI0022204F2B|nr:Atp19 h [Gamsiella multidivaricata]KAI7817744.1 Atp19 h [Gamsiella multidivaricata]